MTLATVQAWLAETGWVAERGVLPAGRTAAIDQAGKRITVASHVPGHIALLAALHEGAHLVAGHDLSWSNPRSEAEAELMALAVAAELGLNLRAASGRFLASLPRVSLTAHQRDLVQCWAGDLRAHT